jgi:HlyD family secretion protein
VIPISNRHRIRSRGRSALAPVAAIALLCATLGIGAMVFEPFGASSAEVLAAGAPVRRGPLRFTTIASGSLRARDTLRLTCAVEGRTSILFVVPEGTQVSKGDLVCELDASLMVERRIEQTIKVANSDAAAVKALQLIEIQESQNLSDIRAARQKLEFAGQDLAMFLDGERGLELESSEQTIDLAREELQRTEGRLSWSEKLSERGFLTGTELEADRIAQHRSEVELRRAQQQLDLLQRFKLPRREAELRAARDEAEQELGRVELQARARLVDLESNRRSADSALLLEREKLTRLEEQIAKARLTAPCDGYVVYAQRDWDDPPIQPGAEVREREEILSIPNTGAMTAEVKLHETVLRQVKLGSPCHIKLDALPGVELAGRVSFVAVMPDQNSRWSNPSTRVYRTEVEILTSATGPRPGMSCSVEILIDELDDVLYTPVQCVFREGDQNLAFVRRGSSVERRAVRVGRYNQMWVQVLEGLKEGEIVLLAAPSGMLKPLQDEEDKLELGDEREPEPAPESAPESAPAPSGG